MDPITWCLILAFVFVNPVERVMHARKGTTPPSHQARMKRMDKAHEQRMARMRAGKLSVGEALQHRIAQAIASRTPRSPVHERGPIGKFLGLWHQDAWEWATAKRRNLAGATGEWRAKQQAKRAEAKAEKQRRQAERERKAREDADVIDAEWVDVDEQEPFTPPAEDTAPEPQAPAPKALDAAVVVPAEPVIPDVPMYRAEPTNPQPAADDTETETDDSPLATVYELRRTAIQGEDTMSAPAITAGTAPVNIGEITTLAEAQHFTSAFAAAADTNLTEAKLRADKLATAATVSDVDANAYATGAASLAAAVEQIAAVNVSGAVLPTLTEASAAMQQIAQKEAQIREALMFAATASAENAELMATVQENVSAADSDLHRHDGLAEQHQALAGDGGDKAFYANA